MKKSKFWLAPVLFIAALFGSGAAVAQQGPVLPDAPTPKVTETLPAPYSFKDAFKAPHYTDSSKPGGFIGHSINFFQNHTLDSDSIFDFAVEKPVSKHFSVVAGTLNDMRNTTGPQAAARQTARVITGLADSQTRTLRNMLAGGQPQHENSRGSDGFAVGIRIDLGRK